MKLRDRKLQLAIEANLEAIEDAIRSTMQEHEDLFPEEFDKSASIREPYLRSIGYIREAKTKINQTK